MRSRIPTITMLLGVFFSLQGLSWLIVPSSAAATLGMPLLDGLARSTQVGDFAAFFLVGGLTTVAGSRPGRSDLLYFPAALIGGAAVTRTLAWALQGAAFAGQFIFIELVTGVFLLTAARRGD